MNINEGRGVLKTKLGFFYFFMLLDIIMCTFVEAHLNRSNKGVGSFNDTIAIVICII